MGLTNKTIVKTFRDWADGGKPLSLEETVGVATEEKTIKAFFIRMFGITESEADRILNANDEYAILAAASKNHTDLETVKGELKDAKEKNERLENDKKDLERQLKEAQTSPAPAPAPVPAPAPAQPATPATPAPAAPISDEELSELRQELSTTRGSLTRANNKFREKDEALTEANRRIVLLERELADKTVDEETLRKAIREAAELRTQLQAAEALKDAAEGKAKELLEQNSATNTAASQAESTADDNGSSAYSTVKLPTGELVNVVVAAGDTPISMEDREALKRLKEKGVVTATAQLHRKPYAVVEGKPVVVESINPDKVMSAIRDVTE